MEEQMETQQTQVADEHWEVIEPKMWKPQQNGDSITGVLVYKEPADKSRELSARYKVENRDGIFLVWGCATLDDRLNHVNIGDAVRITFKEKRDIGKGKTLNIYKVEKQSGSNA
jgi:hypothetical protein|tara:strand:+ start:230 stop:571 length:342 start_codon:yes stop_codon:yes gene_type:complete